MTDPTIAQRRREAAPTNSRPASAEGEAAAAGRADLEARGRKAARDAMRLAVMVRDEEQPVVEQWLASLPWLDLASLAVAAAAMVDVDRTPSELLAWIDFDAPREPLSPRLALVQSAAARPRRKTAAEKRLADGTKHCPQCDADLPLDAFHSDRCRPDGLAGWCRQCVTRRRQERRAAS